MVVHSGTGSVWNTEWVVHVGCVGTVKLVVRYTPKLLEEMEQRFDRQRTARRRQPSQWRPPTPPARPPTNPATFSSLLHCRLHTHTTNDSQQWRVYLPNASEVTTLWHYTNAFLIIFIIIIIIALLKLSPSSKSFIRYDSSACWIYTITVKYKLNNINIKV